MTANGFDDDQTRSFTTIAAGTIVSHYRIISKIGAGGMGEVYLAEDTKLNRNVALKFLPLHLCQDDDCRARFKREAQAAAKLDHPHIVTIHEVNEFGDRPFFSMTYVEGQTLHQLASRRIPSIESIVNLGIQIADALGAAHELGITHRDLKPSNIMIDPSNKIHILDFGLAILPETASEQEVEDTLTKLTSPGDVIGTIPYMAPEQLTGQGTRSVVDIFAFGVILYELCCGERPFAGDSPAELASSILRDTPPRVSDKRHDVPYDLARIITRCLHKSPEKRFQNARDVGNELAELRELLEQGRAPIRIDGVAATGKPRLLDQKFILTADLVRSLSYKTPQIIGDSITYLDNGVDSDLIVIFLHGLGLDQRQFTELLHMFPYRGIAPSLYGFSIQADHRPPLSIEDHSILLRALFKNLQSQYHPKYIVLCGHSTGADHILHLVESNEGVGVKVNGLVCFGCNICMQNCLFSSKLARLTPGNDSEMIEAIREFGHNVGSLNDYLTVCEYAVMSLSKFGSNIEALQRFSIGIMHAFESREWNRFPKRYRTAIQEIPHVRFVFSRYEFEALDEILRRHLESNILGDDFREDTIIRENVSHLALSDPELLMNQTLALIAQIRS
jgi:serine/threonine protein kinase